MGFLERLKLKKPIRVVEREMRGCMANVLHREDRGTVIGYRTGSVYPDPSPRPFWLVRWDGDRPDQWYPAYFFSHQEHDRTYIRTM